MNAAPSGDHPVIEARGLTKRYEGADAVTDLDLRIEAGTVYGFLGPNGAGKTTTMRMLTTLTRPTSGEAWIVGHPVTRRAEVVPHIGFLPEEPPLYDELTGREQLRYVAGLRGIPVEEADRRIDGVLDRLDLLGADRDRIRTYSKGMKQKTALVQAVIHRPEVLFLDEPTSGLDPRAAHEVRQLIQELAEGGMTVFLSTHILSVVEELADVVGVLHRGRLVAEDTPERLTHRAESGGERTLEQAFLEVTSDGDRASEGPRP